MLSPTRVASTGCQYYFLFIGRLSKSVRGREALDQRSILGHFTELLGTVIQNQEYHSEIQNILGSKINFEDFFSVTNPTPNLNDPIVKQFNYFLNPLI